MAAAFPACGTKVYDPIPAVSLAGDELSLEAAAVKELGESLSGRLLLSGNEGYDVARKVWNGMIDSHFRTDLVGNFDFESSNVGIAV